MSQVYVQSLSRDRLRISSLWVVWLIGVCVLPGVLIALGLDLSTTHDGGGPPAHENPDSWFAMMKGDLVHTILEWTAVMVALFTVLLSFAHYAVTRDVIASIIAIAFFWSGTMDAFHILAANRMITATAPNEALLPFTWALCRTFNAVIPLAALSVLLLAWRWQRGSRLRRSPWLIVVVGLVLGVVAYEVIHYCATSASLPQTMSRDALIPRPWDVYPLVIYAISGLFIYPRLLRKSPSYFAAALWLSVIPDVATQLYMAVGSTSLFDSYFNLAHGLKIVAYLVPCAGLVADYIHTSVNLENEVAQRRRTEASLKARTEALRSSNQALVEAREQAEQAGKAKAEFLANMSHELRTPLNGVVGMLSVLTKNELETEHRDMIDTAMSAARHLAAITDDILDVSKLDAGKLHIEAIPMDMARVLRATARGFETPERRASQDDLRFRLDIAALPPSLLGDPIRIRQIVSNFLSNAFKFTPSGEIVLRAECAGKSSESALIVISVSDTGIGIPADRIEHIFDQFTQAESSTTRRFGGTGLGLAICRRLALLMDGQVSVDSTLGKGSTFWLRLPMALADETSMTHAGDERDAPDHDIRPGLEVLVVEDNPINQKVIQAMLRRLLCQVDLARNGSEALERCAARRYDLILMDCYMPIMDGFTATVALREHEQDTGTRTPIIALTASALAEDRRRCIDAGMDAVLTKPLEFTALEAELSRVARGPGQPTASRRGHGEN